MQCKENRPLLEYVQKVEKSYAGEQMPKNIKPERRGGQLNHFLHNTRPQILGFDVTQVQQRVEILESFGMASKDALSVAFEVPSHLEFKRETLKPLGELLNNLGCNLPRLFVKAPYIFGIDFSTIDSNVRRIESVGISREVIGKAIDTNPLVVVYPVSDKACEIIKGLLSSCEFDDEFTDSNNSDFRKINQSEFALRLLLQPFDGAREQVVLGDNFKQAANFLKEIQVSPCLMVLSCPAFFSTDVEKLKVFEERVKLLKEILNTPRQLYVLLQKYFFFQGNEVELEDNIKILKKYKFPNEQIADILTAKHFFTSGVPDLEKKLKFLLSVEGINVDLIAENSHCLLKTLKSLENRVSFAKKSKKELLESINMDSLFLSDDVVFATVICESSVEKYEELTGEIISQKKSKSRQKRMKGTN
ncbi:hypothetical protein AC249_AIPGENE26204 [Exaiptasia diaphana]|nr:hypothetical protein AC249_AIPGENE26204 [Exaiptasia diaphana]